MRVLLLSLQEADGKKELECWRQARPLEASPPLGLAYKEEEAEIPKTCRS